MLTCNICDCIFRKYWRLIKHLNTHYDEDSEYIKKINFDNIKYVYVHIPKCAGTTIRARLKDMYDCVILDRNENLDNYIDRVINFHHTCFTNCIFKDKIICFVRHPYSRAISMYNYHKLYKFNNSINEFIKKIYNNKKVYNYIKNVDNINKNINFNLLKTAKGNSFAYSWKNQSVWIPKNIFFLGKVEFLEEDLEKLCNKLNCNYFKSNMKENITGYNKNCKLNNESKKMIYDLYKTDFERFRYEH
jgi:hypothetical protein